MKLRQEIFVLQIVQHAHYSLTKRAQNPQRHSRITFASVVQTNVRTATAVRSKLLLQRIVTMPSLIGKKIATPTSRASAKKIGLKRNDPAFLKKSAIVFMFVNIIALFLFLLKFFLGCIVLSYVVKIFDSLWKSFSLRLWLFNISRNQKVKQNVNTTDISIHIKRMEANKKRRGHKATLISCLCAYLFWNWGLVLYVSSKRFYINGIIYFKISGKLPLLLQLTLWQTTWTKII